MMHANRPPHTSRSRFRHTEQDQLIDQIGSQIQRLHDRAIDINEETGLHTVSAHLNAFFLFHGTKGCAWHLLSSACSATLTWTSTQRLPGSRTRQCMPRR